METMELTPSTELTVFVEQSGIEKSKGNAITESLGVFFAKAQEWDSIISGIVINDISETGKMKMAREGRLTLKNLRLDSDKVVKAKRDEIKYRMANEILEDKLWLKAGQMVEAVYKNLETKLEEKEKFAERKEQDRKEKIRNERVTKLAEYPEFDAQYTDLLNMPDESFTQLVSGLQIAKDKRIADEKAAEEFRIKKEKEEAAERERIRIENENLKAAAIEKEKELAKERAKVAKEKAIIEAKAEADRKISELKAKKEREAASEKLRIEREKSDKLQAELKAKADAELKAKRESDQKDAAELKAQQLADKKAKAAPDKIKLAEFRTMLDELKYPECKSEEARKIVVDSMVLVAKIVDFISKKTAEL
jgi:colicin import membrane protein